MPYSVEAIYKNTFLTFAVETTDLADESLLSSSMAAPRMPRRSRSAETARSRPEAEELQDLFQSSIQRLTSVLNVDTLQPSVESSQARSPARTSRVEVLRSSSPATTGQTLALKRSFGFSSNCSLSTLADDDSENSTPTWGLKRAACSSGSLKSMVSWADTQEEVEFALDIEAGASAAREGSAAERPAVPCPFPCSQPTVTGKVSPAMSHSLVPKTHNMAEMYKSAKSTPPTTLMIRNIPGMYSQGDLMMDLKDEGFDSTYDFLYLPIDKVTTNNVGYAFVNFVDPATAAKCMESFEGHCFARLQRTSKKLARISVAHLQGLENNMQHYANTAVKASKEKRRRPVVTEIARSRPQAQGPPEQTQLSLQQLLQPVEELSQARSPARTPHTEASRTSISLATSLPVPKKSLGSNQKFQGNSLRAPSKGSSCSLDTMAPDDASETSGPTSGLKRAVWSSGSLKSMVSWADMDEAEHEEVQFELVIEAGASAAREESVVERAAMPCLLPLPCPQPQVTVQVSPAMSQGLVPRSHGLVPKTHNMAEMYESTKGAPPTTLMIRNIPGKYSQDDLIMDLKDEGFDSTYDFLYLPIDQSTAYNVGYAFVNFADPATAAKCMESFEGHLFARLQRAPNKVAKISVAHLQGLKNNLQHYEKSGVNLSKEKRWRPLVVANLTNMFV